MPIEMAITRRAFGTLKSTQNGVNTQKVVTVQETHNVLKRPLLADNSPSNGIPSKRKPILAADKENQIIKIETIGKKITEIKITEEYTNISLSSSSSELSLSVKKTETVR